MLSRRRVAFLLPFNNKAVAPHSRQESQIWIAPPRVLFQRGTWLAPVGGLPPIANACPTSQEPSSARRARCHASWDRLPCDSRCSGRITFRIVAISKGWVALRLAHSHGASWRPKPTGYGHVSATCPKPRLTSFRTYEKIRTSISYIGCRMSRVFAYCRVSTTDQTTENQVLEISAAGFAINGRRIVEETISGSVPAEQRPGFQRLMDKLEPADVLVVTKLDRLGRNAMDVRATVEKLAHVGVRVHCLALGGVDLTSPAGKMTMGVIAAVAEFERDLLIERTQAGLALAKASGKAIGRPQSLDKEQIAMVRQKLSEGHSVASLAREFGTSRQTIMRVRDAQAQPVA